jgi:hypothetical protein
MTSIQIASAFVETALYGIEDPTISEHAMLWYVTGRSWFINPTSLELFIVLCEMGRIHKVEEWPMTDDWDEFLVSKISQ